MSFGLDTLAALRRSGRRPHRVNVTAMDRHPRLGANVAEMNACTSSCWFAVITSDEAVHRLDLRALQGLPVEVDGADEARVEAIAHASITAGASRVIANVLRFDHHGQCHTLSTTDTEGVLHAELAA